MANPTSLRRPPIGRRYDPTAIDATGATLGDYLGATDDGSGGKRAGYLPMPDLSDVDPGVGAGTPGNWSHQFVNSNNGTFVLGPHGTALETLGVNRVRVVLNADSFIRGQATVVEAGYTTSYLDCRVSLDGEATWEPDLLGIKVPLQTVKLAVGVAAAVPVDLLGDVVLDPVVVGGNSIAAPEIKNFRIESTSTEPPPADGEDTPVEAGIPRPGDLIAEWYVTEGAGSPIANKTSGSGGTPGLALGSSDAGGDPTWASGPRRLQCPGHPSFQHTFLKSDDLFATGADISLGCACFFIFRHTAGPGGKYICGQEASGGYGPTHFIAYDATDINVQINEVGGGGGTLRAASAPSGTVNLTDGLYHLVGFIHTGATLKLVVDGSVRGSTACGQGGMAAGGPWRFHFSWKGTNLSFATGPDNCDIGDAIFYAAVGIDFTSAELAAMYEQFKLVYSGLP